MNLTSDGPDGPDDPVGANLLDFLFDFRAGLDEPRPEEPTGPSAVLHPAGRFHAGRHLSEEWADDPYAGAPRQVTPQWWLASDGRWYPPELHPDAQVVAEVG